jgi:hypothetical protein
VLPYDRAVLISWLYHGPNETRKFFLSFGVVPPEKKDYESIFRRFLPEKNKELIEYFFQTEFYKRNKKGPKAKELFDSISSAFGFRPKKDPERFFSKNVERILKNRELRILIEVLVIGNVSMERIHQSILNRFKLNTPLEQKDVEEYVFWFFDPAIMDDCDWQEYLFLLKNISDSLNSGAIKKEFDDKSFALRRGPAEVMLRCGLKSELMFSEQLAIIGNSVFDMVREGIDRKIPWNELRSKIMTFKSIGEGYMKFYDPSASSEAFSGTEYELEYDDVGEIPSVNNGLLEWNE